MYQLGTFKSLSGFKGGVVLMTSILMFHLIK